MAREKTVRGGLTIYGAMQKLAQLASRLEADCQEIMAELPEGLSSYASLEDAKSFLGSAARRTRSAMEYLPYEAAVELEQEDKDA